MERLASFNLQTYLVKLLVSKTQTLSHIVRSKGESAEEAETLFTEIKQIKEEIHFLKN